MGGHLHVLPMWPGIGRMHSPAGDYVLYFWVQPVSGGRVYNLPSFKGWGYVCTPRGERLPLRAGAGLNEKKGIDMDGKEFFLGFYRRPWYWRFAGNYDRRPILHFRGVWQNPDLVMDDGGTLAGAFLPDGSLGNSPINYYHANAPNKLQIVFHETDWRGWWDDCRAK